MNSVGTMGSERSDVDDGMLQVDFHGLHIGEMYSKYNELVEAVLPVLKKVRIITGRGLHSASGESKLNKAIKKKIAQDKNVRWDAVPNNPGAIVVSWLAETED